MSKLNTSQVHISQIQIGDAIIHNGEMKTVCNRTRKRDSFMGITLFGDSYSLGHRKVERVNFKNL